MAPTLACVLMLDVVGAWRSLVAHTLGVRVVAGSNPAAPTKPKHSKYKGPPITLHFGTGLQSVAIGSYVAPRKSGTIRDRAGSGGRRRVTERRST